MALILDVKTRFSSSQHVFDIFLLLFAMNFQRIKKKWSWLMVNQQWLYFFHLVNCSLLLCIFWNLDIKMPHCVTTCNFTKQTIMFLSFSSCVNSILCCVENAIALGWLYIIILFLQIRFKCIVKRYYFFIVQIYNVVSVGDLLHFKYEQLMFLLRTSTNLLLKWCGSCFCDILIWFWKSIHKL